ncbi:MAG: hypothetical protein ACRDAS_06615 [Cetobacterium sp.]
MNKLIMIGCLLVSLTTLSCEGLQDDIDKLHSLARNTAATMRGIMATDDKSKERAVVVGEMEDILIEQLLIISHIVDEHKDAPREIAEGSKALLNDTKIRVKEMHKLY